MNTNNKIKHILTISGGSGSGKSTLTEMIKNAVGIKNVLHIEHDKFYKNASKLEKIGDFTNFDTPDALNNNQLIADIKELIAGKSVQLPNYDFQTQTTSSGSIVSPKEIIIIEGIFILTIPEIIKLADFNIFVDVDGEVRLARRIIRDFLHHERSDMGKPGYEDDLMYYLDFVKKGFDKFVLPNQHLADLIVDNNEHTPDQMLASTKKFLTAKHII